MWSEISTDINLQIGFEKLNSFDIFPKLFILCVCVLRHQKYTFLINALYF